MKKLIIMAVAASFCLVGVTTTVSLAANCKNVTVKVNNQRAQEIKVTGAKYWDTEKEKWRSENFSNWKIAPKSNEKKTPNLEYVKNQKVKLYVQYKVNEGGSKWSGTKNSSKVTVSKCTSSSKFSFTIR